MASGTVLRPAPRTFSAPNVLQLQALLPRPQGSAIFERGGQKEGLIEEDEDGAAAESPAASRSCLLVYSAGPALERSRPLLRRLEDADIQVILRTDQDLASEEETAEIPPCDALLVLWSQFFHGAFGRLADISRQASAQGASVLNDVHALIEMQDRRWLLRKLREHGVPTPEFVECSRDGGQRPSLEERDDCIIVDGQKICKPFVEKPVDRRDREIYVYFPKESGGGKALVSTTESGDIEYICSFDTAGNVRREGSFIYQEYLQSEGFVVQTVCVGGLVYGNAVLSGIVGRSQCGISMPEPDSPASSAAGHTAGTPASANVRTGGRACAVWLRQEEKLIAYKLKEVLQQTLFGVTFARSQTADRPATSFVVDVWPGLPRTGLGSHRDDATRALLAEFIELERYSPQGSLARTPHPPGMRRSSSLVLESPHVAHAWTCGVPSSASFQGHITRSGSKNLASLASQYLPHNAGSMQRLDFGSARPDSDLLCVLLVARHGDRTPKQKVKMKIKLACEFTAGWLCGWLADSSSAPSLATTPTTFELRKRDQLHRLMTALQQLQAKGYNTGTLVDALGCITKESLACHAKIGADGATVAVTLKWGGELTAAGVDEAEALGWCFRGKTFPGEDIDELHATLRHDVKIYASKEPRCQQTAAAFSKGLLHLDSPLPPIIAALVRTDEFQQKASSYVKDKNKDPALLRTTTPWEELETLAGPCVSESLRAFETPGPALHTLLGHLERMQQALQEGEGGGPLHKGETYALLLERYREMLAELGPKDDLRFDKVQNVLDHLQYDNRHNRMVLPSGALLALDEALPLAEALCDVVVPLEAALEHREGSGGDRGLAGRSILKKLRWDLRVASGADLGEETSHLNRHEALYALADGAVRTRLYFGHNSWLQGLLGILSSSSGGGCPAGEACSRLMATRLGFLSHITVRLWRQRPSGELRVSCDFAHSGAEEPKQLFELPLPSVDAWWSQVLRQAETEMEDGASAKERRFRGGTASESSFCS